MTSPDQVPAAGCVSLAWDGKTGKHSFMETATLSTKGQLVIPSRFRNALHLQPGDKVAFTLDGERLVMARTSSIRAQLVKGRSGRRLLVAPADAPPMTTDAVKTILTDFP